MRFKEFLYEDGDVTHRNVKLAAEAYVKNCTQWKDVDQSLYRLSEVPDGQIGHAMRSRSPRQRRKASLAGSRDVQEMIFNQKGWENFPDRLHSVFCSTNEQFEVGEVRSDRENLVHIYPFDGAKIAITESTDFNLINLMKGTGLKAEIALPDFPDLISWTWASATGGKLFSAKTWQVKLAELKDRYLDSNGNFRVPEDLEERFDEFTSEEKNMVKVLVTKIPEIWTPEKLGVKLVTPATIEFDGKTHECWFSHKYLSIPAYNFKEFKLAVKELS